MFNGTKWTLLEETTASILLNDEKFMSLSDKNALKKYLLESMQSEEKQVVELRKDSLLTRMFKKISSIFITVVMFHLMSMTNGLIIPVIIAIIVFVLWKKGKLF